MFTHNNELGTALFAFLHGESKHCHSRVVVEHASNHLFADKLLPEGIVLEHVSDDSKVHSALKEAECLDITSQSKLSEQSVVSSTDCPVVIRSIYKALYPDLDPSASEHSVNSIMKELADMALVGNLGGTLWDENGMLHCLVPRAPKKKMERPVVSPTKGGN